MLLEVEKLRQRGRTGEIASEQVKGTVTSTLATPMSFIS